MKQVVSDKYSIAWFKIAECVAKGERERALGIYRLLSHSIDNQALSRQLEADILLFFGDPSALEKYKEAAQLYAQQQRFLEAVAIYEHLLTIGAPEAGCLPALVEWSIALAHKNKIAEYGLKLADSFLQKGDLEQAYHLFQQAITHARSSDRTVSFMVKMIDFSVSHNRSDSLIMAMVHDCLDELIIDQSTQLLQIFLLQLENNHPALYLRSCQYLKA